MKEARLRILEEALSNKGNWADTVPCCLMREAMGLVDEGLLVCVGFHEINPQFYQITDKGRAFVKENIPSVEW